jgi:flagellar basal-body rod modification protein FlgD
LKEIDMTVESIGANLTSSSAALQNAGLSQQDFLKVLTTQLQFQDPLKPMDNDQFLAQMAQFATLGLMQQQTDSTNSLLTIQTASQTVGLLGKSVQVTTSSGAKTGSVTTITFQADGTPQLAVKLADGTILTSVDVSQVSVVQ